MRILGRPWLFDLGAGIYAWFTANDLWRASCAHLADYFPQANGKRSMRVLDLGCGPGVTAIALARARPHAHVIGLDLAPRMISHARVTTARANLAAHISYVLADATALPFASETIDVTTGHSFLYLVPNRAGVLTEAYRVLRRGGRYVSMEPHFAHTQRSLLREHWRNIRHLVAVTLWRPYSKLHGRLDAASFPLALQRAGFQGTGTELVLDDLGIVGYGEKM
jgi:ubiquinone/menaquinone biosynthesis C-methylase UbiE